MPPWYNSTNLTNSDTFVEILQYGNSITGGTYGLMFIIGFWIVLFISFKVAETKKSFAAASFVTAIIAVLLSTINILNETSVLVVFLFVAWGLISLFWERQVGG